MGLHGVENGLDFFSKVAAPLGQAARRCIPATAGMGRRLGCYCSAQYPKP